MTITIDLKNLYSDIAKIDQLQLYIIKAITLAGDGNEIILTGQAPIWLYLAVAHSLHGKAKKLSYLSPVTGEIVIFNHNPFK